VRKKEKASFAVPDSSPVGCGTVSTGKRRLSAREYGLHFQDRTLVRYWNLFTKIGRLCLLYQILNSYLLIT